MRILQVGKFYHPSRGGIETVLQLLAEGLAEKGHQVHVLCAAEQRAATTEELQGVTVERIPNWGLIASQPLVPKLFERLNKLAPQFDILHVHSPNPLAEGIASLLKQPIPIVVTYHSDIVRQKFLARLYTPYLQHFLRRVQAIVVSSPALLEYSLVLQPVREKCTVIPFGLKAEMFQLTDPKIAAVKKLRNKIGPFVLFVGRLVGYKGVSVLIKAMANTNAHLIIIGKGPLERSLQSLVSQLRLQSRVSFLGAMDSQANLLLYYHGCEILVLPSISPNEAFGMVQLEAFACSKPVISTDLRSGVPFVNLDGQSGLIVKPNDPTDLARALNRLLTDQELRERLGRGARQRFEELFQAPKMVQAYEMIYEKARGLFQKEASLKI